MDGINNVYYTCHATHSSKATTFWYLSNILIAVQLLRTQNLKHILNRFAVVFVFIREVCNHYIFLAGSTWATLSQFTGKWAGIFIDWSLLGTPI